jgi:ribosomal protein L11 methyltransferase
MKAVNRPGMLLFVYECTGPGTLRGEPQGEGLLGVWPEGPYRYVFADGPVKDDIERWLEGSPGWSVTRSYQIDYRLWQQIPDSDQSIGRFVIRMSGASKPELGSREDVTVLRIDPGIVFGSGVHESTRGCLLALEWLFGTAEEVGSVVDLGTGTGVLAVACASLGAKRIVAVDCNPLAVRVARRNIRMNGREAVVQTLVANGLAPLRQPGELLIMNLEWPCLKAVLLAPEWLGYGWVVLSGFLEKQWTELEKLIPGTHGIRWHHEVRDWMTVVVAKTIP